VSRLQLPGDPVRPRSNVLANTFMAGVFAAGSIYLRAANDDDDDSGVVVNQGIEAALLVAAIACLAAAALLGRKAEVVPDRVRALATAAVVILVGVLFVALLTGATGATIFVVGALLNAIIVWVTLRKDQPVRRPLSP
jgi:hypothetical protein